MKFSTDFSSGNSDQPVFSMKEGSRLRRGVYATIPTPAWRYGGSSKNQNGDNPLMELLISLYPLHLRYQFPTFKEFMREGALSFRLLPEIGDFMYSEDFDICNGKLPSKMGKPTIQSFMEGEHSFGSYCERVICRQENIDCRQKYEEFVTHMENHHDGNSGDPFWMGVNSPGPSLVDGTRNR